MISPIADIIILIIGCIILKVGGDIQTSSTNLNFTSSIGEFILFYLILVPTACAVFMVVIWDLLEFIFWDLSFSHGILSLIIIIVIVSIILVLAYRESKIYPNPKNKQKLKRKLDIKYINVEERLIDIIILLDKNKKKLLCKAYAIPKNDDEVILTFFAKKWKSNERSNLINGLENINKAKDEIDIYSNLIRIMPISLIRKVMIKNEYKCFECGKNMLINGSGLGISKNLVEQYHHIGLIKPLSERGTITEDNIICLCSKCVKNNKKW